MPAVNWTIELHLPVQAKEKLAIVLLDFNFFALMRFNMTFDNTLRDGSSLGKFTNSCYQNLSFSLLLVLFKHKG